MRNLRICGIERLRDRSTNSLYLTDLNAYVFTSIGHLRDCGPDLPLPVDREIVVEDLSAVDPQPVPRHHLWVDFAPDVIGQRRPAGVREKSAAYCALSFLVANNYAYGQWTDPVPVLHRCGEMFGMALRYRARRRLPKPVIDLSQRRRNDSLWWRCFDAELEHSNHRPSHRARLG